MDAPDLARRRPHAAQCPHRPPLPRTECPGAVVRSAGARLPRRTLVLFYKELPRSVRTGIGDIDTTDSAPFVVRAACIFNAAQVDTAPPAADAPSSMSSSTAPAGPRRLRRCHRRPHQRRRRPRLHRPSHRHDPASALRRVPRTCGLRGHARPPPHQPVRRRLRAGRPRRRVHAPPGPRGLRRILGAAPAGGPARIQSRRHPSLAGGRRPRRPAAGPGMSRAYRERELRR
ncbi:hypothetical protein MPEAHAMD_2924 [Methylobacterium frigidaeris]|uniref:Uncharacterized protein n=1 Tax=Methylobacterium frigidaeris TaxID=2038277 RepID=A0AA37HC29_9HYPH|nr:hypothetical protein MPEAHAMD_2924 [Methylobacterium frigidaeris]